MINFLINYNPFGYAISPVTLFSIGLATWLYIRGLKRSSRILGRIAVWRSALFFGGLVCILVATNAPLAPLGHGFFSVHRSRSRGEYFKSV
jgi:putative membrane protein